MLRKLKKTWIDNSSIEVEGNTYNVADIISAIFLLLLAIVQSSIVALGIWWCNSDIGTCITVDIIIAVVTFFNMRTIVKVNLYENEEEGYFEFMRFEAILFFLKSGVYGVIGMFNTDNTALNALYIVSIPCIVVSVTIYTLYRYKEMTDEDTIRRVF